MNFSPHAFKVRLFTLDHDWTSVFRKTRESRIGLSTIILGRHELFYVGIYLFEKRLLT